MKSTHQTLGSNVVPTNYDLFLKPDMGSFKTEGNETITCEVKELTSEIRLNAKELEVKKATVVSQGKKQPMKIKFDKKLEEVSLTFKDQVCGSVAINLEFICDNNEGMYGFYRSKYTVGGKNEYILSSQFEAADARAAFPCFDEPEFKAHFKVSMLINGKYDAISNMPISSEKKISPSSKLVEFEETPKMSSYLLYLGVGDYRYTKDQLGKLKLRVITTPGKENLSHLPLEDAKKIVGWLQDYFGVPYPLPKLDLIAVPDFAVGAMENWGAITFREVALLGNEKTAELSKQYIAMIIAHEVTHQWFGDLVTMQWWDDLWLNESFAEFMGYKAADAIFPQWKFLLQYAQSVIGTALSADSLRSTHPINVKVNSVGEIDSIFDEISYEKGGSVLYMLEDYVGPEIFRKGLHKHLMNNSYANATKQDLWNAVQDAAKEAGKDLNVSGVIEEWVTKTGHPLVKVKKVKDGFMLEQERYMLTGTKADVWPIPMHYATSGGVKTILMDKQTHTIKDDSEWIKLNYGQRGLYRVKYETPLLSEVGKLIRDKKVSGLDAWGAENDLFSFVRSGRTSVNEYLDFVSDYCMEGNYPLNSSISSHLGWLYLMGYGLKFDEQVKEISGKFHKNLLQKLGWNPKETDDNITLLLRSGAIASLGLQDDPQTLLKANELFNKFMNDGEEINVNIRGAIYVLAAWTGDKKRFDFFAQRYKAEKIPDEQRRFMRALGTFKDPALLQKGLEFAISKDVRLQDSFIIPAVASDNPIGRKMMWNWIKGHWGDFMERFGSGTHMLPKFVDDLAFVSDKATYADISKFFSVEKNMREDLKMELQKTLEKIQVNINFMEKNNVRSK